MATTVTQPPPQPPATSSPAEPPATRDDLLIRHVHAKISKLQATYLDGSPTAAGSLAKLRRAVNASPGSDPGVWFETLDDVPPALIGAGDAASSYEQAIHASITLYAIHQQSQRGRMYQRDYPLGRSVRLLAKRVSTETMKNDNPVLRRFHALGTASSLPETLHHLRGLITQLRAEAIALDYSQLAEDLRRLQHQRTAPGVRLQWGRDYHRIKADPSATPAGDSNPGVPPSTDHDSSIGDPA